MAYFAPGKACGGSGNAVGIVAIIWLEGLERKRLLVL